MTGSGSRWTRCLHDGCAAVARVGVYCDRHEAAAPPGEDRRTGSEPEYSERAFDALLQGTLPSDPTPRYGPMFSDCVIPGCGRVTMGGTCVEHDSPVSVTFPQGRPHLSSRESPAALRVGAQCRPATRERMPAQPRVAAFPLLPLSAPVAGVPRADSVGKMLLMGVPLAPSLLLDLADRLDDEGLAKQLRDAHERRVIAFDLQPEEAEAILSAIDDPPPGLEELRAVLLREIEPRRAAGL